MREQEMRLRVLRFLKVRMRNMLMPATVGIGLVVGGCAQETATPIYSAPLRDGSPSGQTDVVLVSDTRLGAPEAVPVYGSDVGPMDVSGKDMPPKPDVARDGVGIDATDVVLVSDTRLGAPEVVPVYGSQDLRPADVAGQDVLPKPDQAVAFDGGGIDTGTDLGGITKYGVPIPDAAFEKPLIAPLYTAVMPDAGADGPAVRYAAVMRDSGPDLNQS